ncbi:PAS domain S-box-containing protein [Zhouia amylolytica]|uniref:PAS domain S-box-containing protein n=1 Tax=Zhouia amylolytica TaxID=376730 RepID=A0A1I6V0A7_9FLAO|nr:PAS domain-containing protein [Zhouia amylolytica]MCQ0110112.1 PAS domain-containing protein [Zhouia amylolytica]SFT07128.1 PAS domain S-box-containing protein [Zhouia amylolytica]
MKTLKSSGAPLVCWDIYGSFMKDQTNLINKQNDLEVLSCLKKLNRWKTDVHSIVDQVHYDALVLTDTKQDIKWISKGFKQMTGYSIKNTIGRKPKFLQGKDTCPTTLNFIRRMLREQVPFSAKLTNYRKNGEAYHCQINVIPLKNNQNRTTHFIALENETQYNR